MGGAYSVPTDPSRTVQVIGAGYSRTGTSSMQIALSKLLNGPVIHGGTQLLEGTDAQCKSWALAYAARRQGDRERVLKHVRDATRGYVGTTDMPTLDFLPELLELYPEARVVLVGRDPERWARSVAVIGRNVTLWWLPYLLWPIPGWRWFPGLIDEIKDSAIRLLGDGDTTNILAAHNDMVRSVVPPEKLLEMELGDGWAPLCGFLGVPVPDEPFPRVNDAEAVEQYARRVLGSLALAWLGMLSAVGGAAYLALELWRARGGLADLKFVVLGRSLS